jgi:type VI secretion system ImpM family protein
MSAASFTPGCFGKLPVAADFIGHHSHDEDALALERWLQDGVGLARQRFGPRCDALLRGFPETGFILWWSDPRAPVIGEIVPGADRSGRAFPFSLFLQARDPVPEWAYEDWPILFERFFSEALRIGRSVEQDFSGLTQQVDELRNHIPSLPVGDSLPDLLGTATIQTVTCGERDRPGLVSETAAHVRAWVPPSSAHSTGGSPTGLRFPIPAADHDGRVASSFWLGLLRRLLGATRRPPNCLWTLTDGRTGGRLDVYFHPVEPLGFLHLLDSDFESDGLFPVEEGATGAPRLDAQTATGRFARLSDPALPLADALNLLSQVDRRDSR